MVEGFLKENMKTFNEFLSDCGVDDAEALILFLNNLPDNPEAMMKIPGIDHIKTQIDLVFDEIIPTTKVRNDRK